MLPISFALLASEHAVSIIARLALLTPVASTTVASDTGAIGEKNRVVKDVAIVRERRYAPR
ncbi:hypothetical protein [Ktedonobacter robiniae]|uniref:hypothetical protein n=1 Tax=Ktedonobacter robiniae TaxID=2778365 RepID=UPI0019157409|nr:hypothetical protein [Ktedonobacter robiniae]